MTTNQSPEGLAELISRVEYCLDPSTSAKERLGRRAHLTGHDLRTILTALRSHTGGGDAYRTMDASGSPETAETVAWNWISDLAQAQRKADAALLEIVSTPVNGGGKVTRLYRSTTLLAVATTFRDAMNFTVLVRWLAPELHNRTPVVLEEAAAIVQRMISPGTVNRSACIREIRALSTKDFCAEIAQKSGGADHG